MKKINLIWILGILVLLPLANALTSPTTGLNVTLNFPTNLLYNNSNDATVYLFLNATASWSGQVSAGNAGMNATNVTWWFTRGATIQSYGNGTINGSRTSSTSGDWKFNLSTNSLGEGSWTVVAEVRNSTDGIATESSVNSSAITFVIDRTSPSIVLNEPYSGSSVVANNEQVTFKYTPTDTNFGNCSLHVNNQNVKSSTSGNTVSNVTSGNSNTFTNRFENDNNSVRSVIQCIDLAGNYGNSQNITFNIIKGAIAPVIRQLQYAEAAGQAPSLQASSGNANNIAGGLAAAPSSGMIGNFDVQAHLQNYGYLYVIGILVIGGLYAFRKKFR